MSEGSIGQVDAAEHAGQLPDPAGLIEHGHASLGFVSLGLFLDVQVLMGLGGHLGQVGHREDLALVA
jgi:hypothetical protein